MIKIAIISPFMANGGAERVAITEAEALSKFFDVTLIVMDSFQIDYPYSGKMIDLKLSLIDRNIFKRVFNMASSVWKLRKLKKLHYYDMVISHGELANIPNILSGGQKNIIVVHQNRFAAMKDMQGKVVNWLIKYLYSMQHVSKIVTVSAGIKESFIELLGLDENHIQVIYNPYDISYIQKETSVPLGEISPLFKLPVLTTAGRLTMAKGQWYLLRIFKSLKCREPQVKLVILGEGEMREKLVSLSQRLGFKTYTVWGEKPFDVGYDVYFMGFQKNPFHFIHASKLFVMTSLWEGFGGTIVEAMASGTPVISTNCPSGPGEIIAPYYSTEKMFPYLDENGILMPTFENKLIDETKPLNIQEQLWVDTLSDFLKKDEELSAYAKKGIQRAKDFSLETIMLQWKVLIENSFKEV